MGRARNAPAAQKNGATLTDYIVLQAWQPSPHELPEWWPPGGVAWVPVTTAAEGSDLQVHIFQAPSKQGAIRQHTGEGADVKEGTWKAVPLSSWKGGETTKRVTASERLPLEDAV